MKDERNCMLEMLETSYGSAERFWFISYSCVTRNFLEPKHISTIPETKTNNYHFSKAHFCRLQENAVFSSGGSKNAVKALNCLAAAGMAVANATSRGSRCGCVVICTAANETSKCRFYGGTDIVSRVAARKYERRCLFKIKIMNFFGKNFKENYVKAWRTWGPCFSFSTKNNRNFTSAVFSFLFFFYALEHNCRGSLNIPRLVCHCWGSEVKKKIKKRNFT